MKIQVQHLVRNFGKTCAVKDLSFEFHTGSIIGFIGPNGAGKTTTIKIMSTLDLPTSGDVLYDGVSVVTDPDTIRRFIGYMPDSLPAFRDIQVWEYLDFYARAFGLKGEQRRKTLQEVEEFTNLTGIRQKYLNSLSKGMKQRVSLARALIHSPQILIMDEPAAGLDPRARLELRSLLQILAEQGKAIFLSSHILSELQDICDSAVIIEKGTLLSSGPLDQLLQNAQKSSPQNDKEETIIVAAAPTPLIPIHIRVLRDTDICKQKLLEMPSTKQIEVVNAREIHFLFDGTVEEIPAFIAALIEKGLPIIEFIKPEAKLEDLFMQITKGTVQ